MKKLNGKKEIVMEESTFLKRNAKKILIGTGIIVGIGTYYILKKHGIEIKDLNNKLINSNAIALRSLKREKQDALFEIDQLKDYINNLDANVKINKFVNIPEAEKRINELLDFISEINEDMDSIRAK